MREILMNVGGRLYEGGIQSLSKFGALICTTATLPVGATVTLAIDPSEGESVSVIATIVARIDPSRAARLGIATGIAVRYAAGEEEASIRFAREVARDEESAPSDASRKTRLMIQPILSSLVFASKRAHDAVRVGLQGDLEYFDCGTLCSAMERTHRSGRLLLQRLDATATIDFIDGEIVRVQSSWESAPRRILFEVFAWKYGSFELRSMQRTRTPSHQALRVTPLLIEHIQRQTA